MAKIDPQVDVMRRALEEVMTKVPLEYSTSSTKAYLAECILKAAAQGRTTFDELLVAASDQKRIGEAQFIPKVLPARATASPQPFTPEVKIYAEAKTFSAPAAWQIDAWRNIRR